MKKKIQFATGGFVSPQSTGDNPFGEMVVTEEERKQIAEFLKDNTPHVVVPSIKVPSLHIPKELLSKVVIVKPENERAESTMEKIERMREEHRKTKLEDNHPVMEFLEDIIYCPSQIEFYFRDGEQVYCLYIRQRHGETTAQLVPCFGSGDFDYDALWPEIELSRDYDIEGESYCHDEREEQEIIAIEKDCLARLRIMFPDTPFPEHPNRRRGRYGERLPDVLL